MKSFFLILLLTPFALFAQTLSDGAYILTHPSKHYQTAPKLINSTNDYLESFYQDKAQIIALYQIPIEADPLWYARPTSYFTESYYSGGGGHQLRFPRTKRDSYTIYLSGGYLSACLGRTASNLIYDFLRPEVNARNLRLIFLSKSVFTGFLDQDGSLVPETPYWESVLDDSIDGLSFSESVDLVPEIELKHFLYEAMEIALIKKAPFAERSKRKDFNLIVNYQRESFYLIKANGDEGKTINVYLRAYDKI